MNVLYYRTAAAVNVPSSCLSPTPPPPMVATLSGTAASTFCHQPSGQPHGAAGPGAPDCLLRSHGLGMTPTFAATLGGGTGGVLDAGRSAMPVVQGATWRCQMPTAYCSSTQIQYLLQPAALNSNLLRPLTVPFKVNRTVRCAACDITLNSPHQARQHYNGKAHQRRLQRLIQQRQQQQQQQPDADVKRVAGRDDADAKDADADADSRPSFADDAENGATDPSLNADRRETTSDDVAPPSGTRRRRSSTTECSPVPNKNPRCGDVTGQRSSSDGHVQQDDDNDDVRKTPTISDDHPSLPQADTTTIEDDKDMTGSDVREPTQTDDNDRSPKAEVENDVDDVTRTTHVSNIDCRSHGDRNSPSRTVKNVVSPEPDVVVSRNNSQRQMTSFPHNSRNDLRRIGSCALPPALHSLQPFSFLLPGPVSGEQLRLSGLLPQPSPPPHLGLQPVGAAAVQQRPGAAGVIRATSSAAADTDVTLRQFVAAGCYLDALPASAAASNVPGGMLTPLSYDVLQQIQRCGSGVTYFRVDAASSTLPQQHQMLQSLGRVPTSSQRFVVGADDVDDSSASSLSVAGYAAAPPAVFQSLVDYRPETASTLRLIGPPDAAVVCRTSGCVDRSTSGCDSSSSSTVASYDGLATTASSPFDHLDPVSRAVYDNFIGKLSAPKSTTSKRRREIWRR